MGKVGAPKGSYVCKTSYLVQVNKSTKEGRLLRQVRMDLFKQIGRIPTPTDKMLVERAAFLQLRITQMDERLVAGDMPEHMHNTYLAWVNAQRRLLKELGLTYSSAAEEEDEPAPDPGRKLREHLSKVAAA